MFAVLARGGGGAGENEDEVQSASVSPYPVPGTMEPVFNLPPRHASLDKVPSNQLTNLA